MTKHTLEEAGYRVIVASDGADGIAQYASHRSAIDLVLTDMMMPIMDGGALMQALVRINPDVKVIVASGLPANALKIAPHRENAHFLAKPFTAEALLAAVRHGLDGNSQDSTDSG